jgi:hypothetical protein
LFPDTEGAKLSGKLVLEMDVELIYREWIPAKVEMDFTFSTRPNTPAIRLHRHSALDSRMHDSIALTRKMDSRERSFGLVFGTLPEDAVFRVQLQQAGRRWDHSVLVIEKGHKGSVQLGFVMDRFKQFGVPGEMPPIPLNESIPAQFDPRLGRVELLLTSDPASARTLTPFEQIWDGSIRLTVVEQYKQP